MRTTRYLARLCGFGIAILLAAGSVGSQPLFPDPVITLGESYFSVAAGDFDGDGWQDLAALEYYNHVTSVFLGNGDGTFVDAGQFALGSGPSGIAVGDLNGDGRADLVAANFSSDDISVLLAKSDGSFFTQLRFGVVGGEPCGVAIAELNGDGNPDLVVTKASDVSILLGQGNGSFDTEISVATSDGACSVAVDHLDGDAILDLALPHSGNGLDPGTVSILLGQGDGSFVPGSTLTAGIGTSFVIASDLDGDTHRDLAVANRDSNDVSIFLGYGDGTFAPDVRHAVGTEPIFIGAADSDGSGSVDLAVADYGLGPLDSLSVLLGDGSGGFGPETRFRGGRWPASIAIEDFDRDGTLDLAVGSGGGHVNLLLGRGDGAFGTDARIGAVSGALTVGQFDDGDPLDLAVASGVSDDVSTLLGVGDGSFLDGVALPVGQRPRDLVAGHFNGDDDLDFATVNVNSEDVSVLLTDGTGSFMPETRYSVNRLPNRLGVADFGGDGPLDLLIVNSFDVSVLWGFSDGTFAPEQRYVLANRPYDVAVGDFNGDGRPDAALPGRFADAMDQVCVMPGGTGGTFGSTTCSEITGEFKHAAAADFNGDSRLDLALAASTSVRQFTIAFGNGDATFSAGPIFDLALESDDLAARDVNLDGFADLVVPLGEAVAVLLGRGDGTFLDAMHFVGGERSGSVVIADLDDDGREDLAIGNAYDVSILLGQAVAPCMGAFDTDLDGVDDVCDVCPGVFNPDQRESVACVALTEDGGPCLEAQVDLRDGSASGEILVFDTFEIVPDSVSFDVLSTVCFPPDGGFDFSLNGILLATDEPTAVTCICADEVHTLTVSDPTLLESAWSPGGSNLFAMDKTTNRINLAWVRVRLDSGTDHFEFCLFDEGLGSCDVEDICSAETTSAEFTTQHELHDPFLVWTLLTAIPYSPAQFPDSIDIGSSADRSRVCVSATGLGMNCVPVDRQGEQEMILNGASCSFGPPAGTVPDGATVPGVPLVLGKGSGGDAELSWNASCVGSDTDYAVYMGSLGEFNAHSPATCSTAGATTWSDAGSESAFYLIVPQNGSVEGSYGTDWTGAQRSPSNDACVPQWVGVCP